MWNIFIMKDFGKIQFLHVAQMQLFETEKKKAQEKRWEGNLTELIFDKT